jgi:hypothetical protein
MISNARIQSVFAKAILDVRFLDSLEGKKKIYSPGEKKSLRLTPQNIQSLRLFSAFIAKVQHNYLWKDFPLTLTTIRKLGIDLEIFNAYLSTHQQIRKEHPAPSIEEKKNRFIRFFKNYTSRKTESSFIQANTIFIHEDIYRQAGEIPEPPDKNKKKSTGRTGMKRIPEINGRIWIAELHMNPGFISSILSSDELLKIYNRKKRYCYWLNKKNEELQIFEVSKKMTGVLQAINGKKSMGQFSEEAGYTNTEAGNGQKEMIKSLTAMGIVSCK